MVGCAACTGGAGPSESQRLTTKPYVRVGQAEACRAACFLHGASPHPSALLTPATGLVHRLDVYRLDYGYWDCYREVNYKPPDLLVQIP